ncbi:DUF485 domain-containing protein [Streptomyces cacaoi]
MRNDDPWSAALPARALPTEALPAEALPAEEGGHRAATAAPAVASVPPAPSVPPGPVPAVSSAPPAGCADIYLTVQRSAAFQRVRRRHRAFVLPAAAAFLLWYLGYLVLATGAPGLMAREVAGVLNVGMVAGLAQFATVFLLTWAYARHARLRRDGPALELRWETQDMTRVAARHADVPADGTAGAARGEGPR